ncbi:helicase C-terminal domain-containing protein [Lentzea sp. BCCO 10_0856]|uniref:Helicase C-terminal domain-containing protein n=1 Tax=Lentzea miocenica TaxID=3095431 RepID=A0ABU4TD99_9PSEU|nr:helicase C-terminal domain-containing protein [Lentzea sp. BCCO 10_0856]MDX8035873.1 helicase C-terminal domain-containing protein [Lentzea sp. BCCO 10_0856]
MDFEKLLSEKTTAAPIEPRELYSSLPDKAKGYGYLRDVQGQILTTWHERRHERDLVVKVNTGGGKTIDGLVILRSYLNEGRGPALYVAPDKYLALQVREEADRIGIATVDDPDNPRYLSGDAIAVINAYKLVNGRSVFSSKRPTRPPAPIGSVVIDDAHAALAITRQKLTIGLSRSHDAFDPLLRMFRGAIGEQAPNALLDLDDESPSALARVPFWAWRDQIDAVRAQLHRHRETEELFYVWPAIADVLHLCRAVFTANTLTITPFCPPIRHVTGFADAQHRVYLTATLADDSILVSDFGADPASVRAPISPLTAGDIGERMILAPQEINPGVVLQDARDGIAQLAHQHNVVVLVPSDRAATNWTGSAQRVVHADDMAQTVEDLRAGFVGLVVFVNKYDGIDLPDNACRVLVLDGLPEVATGDERLEAQLLRRAGTDDRQIQRIEQGIGRGVRSNEDHCVVFLLGSRLSQLVADPRSFARFGPATQAQLELSRTVAMDLEGESLDKIMAVANQALNRDPGWIKLAKLTLAAVPPQPGNVTDVAVAQRAAFEAATDGDYRAAAEQLEVAASTVADNREKGWLLEQRAAYLDQIDPVQSQHILVEARKSNPSILRPLSGVTYERLALSEGQGQRAADILASLYGTPAELRLGFRALTEDLVFDKERTDAHENALARLADHLGLTGQRPEQDLGEGPDVLWALGNLGFWVIEAKSGSRTQVIHKGDANQLAGSMNWFRERYDPTARATPVMVHKAHRLADDAAAAAGMKVLDEDGLNRLRTAVLAFATGLAADRWDRAATVDRHLAGHKLRAADLSSYLRDCRLAR